MRRLPALFFSMLSLVVLAFLIGSFRFELTGQAQTTGNKQAPAPVEKSMHEFMEYVFQPTYKRLKAALATAPADRKVWTSIKSDALILAEGGNLLLIRKPKNHAAVWTKHAIDVRTFGGQLYHAARKKDYPAARRHYTSMLRHCNSCHKVFAEGKYQLKP